MRSMKVLTAVATAVTVGSVGLIHALTGPAVAEPTASGEAVPVVMGMQSLKVATGSGLDGVTSLRVGGGKVILDGRAITGGSIRLDGEVALRGGADPTRLSGLSVDIGTGAVGATLNGKSPSLATVDTGILRLRKNAGAKTLYVTVGLDDSNDIELTAAGAAALNEALGEDRLQEGDAVLVGAIAAGVDGDEKVATILGVGQQELIEQGVDIDVDLGADVDLGDDLEPGLQIGPL